MLRDLICDKTAYGKLLEVRWIQKFWRKLDGTDRENRESETVSQKQEVSELLPFHQASNVETGN